MRPATAEPAARAARFEPALPLEALFESPTNPRKTFDPAKLAELADSIRSHGVLEPLVVRPVPGGAHEVVAGARRLRAAALAGISSVPAMVRPMTDREALEVQVIENLQREDVDAFEEAAGYRQLMGHGYSAAELAARVGRHVSYVYRRLALTSAAPEVVEACRAGKVRLGHAAIIAALAQPDQAKMVDHAVYWRDDSQARNCIRSFTRQVAEAAFDTEDATLVPAAGKCSACPKRTGAQPELFAVLDQDTCLDHACWDAKAKARLDRELAKAGDIPRLSMRWGSAPEGVVPHQRWSEAVDLDEDEVEESEGRRGIIVDGPRAGEIVTVVVEPEPEDKGSTKAAAESNRIKWERERLEGEKRRRLADELAAGVLRAKKLPWTVEEPRALIALLGAGWTKKDRIAVPPKATLGECERLLVHALAKTLQSAGYRPECLKDLQALAKRAGVDVAAAQAAVQAKLAEEAKAAEKKAGKKAAKKGAKR